MLNYKILVGVLSLLLVVFLLLVGVWWIYIGQQHNKVQQPITISEDVESGAGYRFLNGYPVNRNGERIEQSIFIDNERTRRGVRSALYGGDYSQAAELNSKILKDPGLHEVYTVNQIEDARSHATVNYRLTGRTEDAIEAIAAMKANILDKSISLRRRAINIHSLATAPHWMARDPEAMRAIFAEEPFKSYWTGDPVTTVRDMLLWSYHDVYPTPKAASTLAYWYIDQLLLDARQGKEILTADERTKYKQKAKRYIAEGEQLAAKELKKRPSYAKKQRYVGYLYRSAFAIGGLAALGEVSIKEYKDSYRRFFSVSRDVGHDSTQYKPFAYVLQAKFDNMLDLDIAGIVDNLHKAVVAVETDPVPQANEIVDFIGDKTHDRTGRFSWYAIHDMRKLSDEWDRLITKIELANQ